MARLEFRISFRAPKLEEVHEVMDRWHAMKRELGEVVTSRDINEELVPLICRLYTCEVR